MPQTRSVNVQIDVNVEYVHNAVSGERPIRAAHYQRISAVVRRTRDAARPLYSQLTISVIVT